MKIGHGNISKAYNIIKTLYGLLQGKKQINEQGNRVFIHFLKRF